MPVKVVTIVGSPIFNPNEIQDRPMERIIAIFLVLTAISGFPGRPKAQQNIVEGKWMSGSGSYVFESDGDFTAVIQYPEAAPDIESGASRFGKDVCWVTVAGEKRYGNLVTYLSSDHCCFSASIVGSKLVLSSINPGTSYSNFSCSNKTLARDAD